MIRMTLDHKSGAEVWYRSRWNDGEDPFRVIDEDVSPKLAISHINEAADHIFEAMKVLRDNDEEILFNLCKYTNFDDYMTMENQIAMMLAIILCSSFGRAHMSFRSERELTDVVGKFVFGLIESIQIDDMPDWLKTLMSWESCNDLIYTWNHTTDTHAFRIAALVMNLLFGDDPNEYDKPEFDKFGIIKSCLPACKGGDE